MWDSFDDFYAFMSAHPEIATKLLNDVGEGEWQNQELYYYPSLEDYAEYELTEGWYIDLNLDDFDFRGAPNPLDYIDFSSFGEALINSGDESVTWCDWDTDDKAVVTTGYGW